MCPLETLKVLNKNPTDQIKAMVTTEATNNTSIHNYI